MNLHLHLKGEYFDAIIDGSKFFEFRLRTPYWAKRLVGRSYSNIIFLRGYPAGDGVEGETRLTRPYSGFQEQQITHPHFGPAPVYVFAIFTNCRSLAEVRHCQDG